jgi:hypothetical protein
MDGTYRKIKVEVDRKDVEVRTREGYTGPLLEPAEDEDGS